jgi:hypothetical protein
MPTSRLRLAHPAPVEARLLMKSRLQPVLGQPPDGGVAISVGISRPSPASDTVRAAAIESHPGSASLRTLPRRVLDQRALECCVSCALTGAMEVRNPTWPALAPIFHYHVTRFINGGADAQGRLFLDRGLGTLVGQGICRESDHESVFTETAAKARPTPTAFDDALSRRMMRDPFRPRFQAVGGASRSAELRRQLRANNPVVLTFTLPMGYPDAFLSTTHEWRHEATPPPSGSHHCVLIVGFDDLRQAARVFDSHGADAFDRGMWWMAYRIIDSTAVHQAFALT